MSMRKIETQLTIRAVDAYSPTLRKMNNITGQFADNVRAQMGGLQNLRGPLKMIEDFRKSQSVVNKSAEALAKARERVRQLKTQITQTREPSAKLRREFDRARASADKLEQTHNRNRRALNTLRTGLREAGVSTNKLASEEKRLASALAQSTTAFGQQMERMRRLGVMQDKIRVGRDRMNRSLATAANLSFVGNASMQTGRRILTAMSSPVSQAIDFETSMSDVRKVVDFDAPEGFAQMSDDILELSTRIPIAASGLAEIVAAGGQSGIATSELTRFAEMAAKIGVAFDISAGQTGNSMAFLKTSLKLTLDETGLLFDAMNHLSNSTAASAPKTLDFMNRVGVDGQSFGFSDTETLAMGAAMLAAGENSDVAATSFRNMGKALVRGDSATTRQKETLSALGLEASAVALAMQEDAVATTMDVMERLNALPEHLQASMRSDLFGDEARGLTKLIGNMDLLRETLGLVAEEESYIGSADAEYEVRAKTTANNIQWMKNQLTVLGVTVGEVVLPPLNDLLEKSMVIVKSITEWAKEHPKLVKSLLIGGAALGAMAVVGGVFLTAAAGIIGTMAVMRFGLVGLGARAVFAGGNLLGLGRVFSGLGRLGKFSLKTLITPIRWGASLIPSINWGAIASRLGKFGMNATGWGKLITPLKWFGRGALRFIPVIGWALLAADIGMFAWKHLGLKELPWRDYLNTVIDWKDRFFSFEWLDFLPEWNWNFISDIDFGNLITWPEAPAWLKWLMDEDAKEAASPSVQEAAGFAALPQDQQAAAQTLERNLGVGDLPTAAYLGDLSGYADSLWAEISQLQDQINNLGDGPMTQMLAAPIEQEMQERISELEEIEAELAAAKIRAGELSEALLVLSNSEVTPEINMESVDRALAKVTALASGLQSLPGGRATAGGSTPLQRRAKGGPFGTSPLLVGENGPEVYFPNRAGFIANNGQLQRMNRLAQGLRVAGLATLAATGPMALPAAAAPNAVPMIASDAGARASGDMHIGTLQVNVPPSVTDPREVVELIARELKGAFDSSHFD